jgi:hypothetical protein
MHWNDHWRLEGRHAFLSPSKFHWIRYDEAKLRQKFANDFKAQEGSELHDLAAILIRKGIRLPRNNKTLNAYVNDAIGFRMDPEVPLAYKPDSTGDSDFFGTADAISYNVDADEGPILRIHDLKTGVHPGNMDQLKVYAALFFLEYSKLYRVKPHDVQTRLRLYQNDTVIELIADPDEIVAIMDWGKKADKIVKEMKEVMM